MHISIHYVVLKFTKADFYAALEGNFGANISIEQFTRDFAKLLLLFSLPIVYIFKSHSLAVLYCLGLFALNTNIRYETDYSYLLKLIYLAAIIPYICRAALNEKDSRGVLMSAATVLPLVVF